MVSIDNEVMRLATVARDASDAEDLVSDTLLRALERWEQYHLGTNIRAWLFTILYHVFVSRKRRTDAREVQQPEDTEGWALSDPEGTVKSRLFRGRRLLQRTLANYAMAMGYLTASVVRAAVTPHVTVVVGAYASALTRRGRVSRRRRPIHAARVPPSHSTDAAFPERPPAQHDWRPHLVRHRRVAR